MFGAVRHGLVHIFDPRGRDARQTFWYYVLFVVLLRVAGGMVVSIPLTVNMMRAGFEAAQRNDGEAVVQAQMMQQMTGMMQTMAGVGIVIGVVTIVLLAASLARRLHDSGLSGWLVLVPGLSYAVALAMLPVQMDRTIEVMQRMQAPGSAATNPMAMMQAQGPIALLGWVPALFVVIFGVLKSTDGPNRYGDEPTRF